MKCHCSIDENTGHKPSVIHRMADNCNQNCKEAGFESYVTFAIQYPLFTILLLIIHEIYLRPIFEKDGDCGKNDDIGANVQDGSMEVARLGVDFDMRRKGVATQLVKKLEKVIIQFFCITHGKVSFIVEFILFNNMKEYPT